MDALEPMGEFTPTALIGLIACIAIVPYAVWSRSPARAILFAAFGATLFGPEGAYIKLPLMPAFDKTTLPYVCLFVVALLKWRKRIRYAGAFRRIDWLIIVAIVGAVGTALTNQDALRYGSWIVNDIPAMTVKDGFANGVFALWFVGLPFLLGRWFFRSRRDLDALFHFLVAAALVQTLFALLELRLSPFLHEAVYGYAAHNDWLQVLRWGGYRPVNFMAHGLALGLFMAVAVLAAAALKRNGEAIRRRLKPGWVFGYLFVLLVLCKSTGAILYAIAFVPFVLRATPKTQMRLVFVVAMVTASYPLLRMSQTLPVDDLLDLARNISEERAESLQFRFDNEEMLAEKAQERFLFGWGTYGRNGIYDDELGKEISVADGHWIVTVSCGGIARFASEFGLLLLPLFFMRKRIRYFRDPEAQLKISALAVILCVCAFDLIPNGMFSNYVFLLAGALTGFQHEAMRGASWAQPAPTPPRRRT